MSKIVDGSVKMVQKYLPEPFIFAIILTFVAFILAMPICHQSPIEVMDNWGKGVWGLLAFSMQMALVLVCGSALADAPVIKRGLNCLASIPKSPKTAIAIVSLVSAIACWINWGFGLIVGVVFAKAVARRVKGVDYRLLIASAYSGFVVWHGGLSGSIPLALSSAGESLAKATMGVVTEAIPLGETILSLYNLILSLLITTALVVVNTIMHPDSENAVCIRPELLEEEPEPVEEDHDTPARRLEQSHILSWLIALMGVAYLAYYFIVKKGSLDLNAVIMIFLFLGIILHGTPIRYVRAITKATSGCAGILLQFPFYAGIMGIMTGVGDSGLSLAGCISNGCISISNSHTFPILTFLSAGIVNVFVPSGGGQWAVQAPIMMPAGAALGVSPALTGMAIAWGDAWTNLIQPFWAIPALAIAKLGAKEIMGFCLIDLLVTGIIICGMLLLWSF